MNEGRLRDEMHALLGPADDREQQGEARWLEITARALPARRRSWPMLAVLAAAVVVLAVVLRLALRSRADRDSELVALEVIAAERVVADGRAVAAPGPVRFRERLELESKREEPGCLAAGADRVWWRGDLVLVTERDRDYVAEEKKMSPSMLRIGKWTLAVLAGSIALTDPALPAAPREPVATRATVDPPSAAPAPGEEHGVTVSGRVLDPDGKPVAGARVYVMPYYYSRTPIEPAARTQSDAEGRFTMNFDPAQCRDRTEARPDAWRNAQIIATADGFGPAWIAYRDVREEITLRLVTDLPLEGRVVDLEGRPIAGARVHVLEVQATQTGDLSEYLKAFALGEMPWGPKRHVDPIDSETAISPSTTTTDPDGRFTLRGIGRERIGRLEISGETIAYTRLTIGTRLMEPITVERQRTTSLPEMDRIWGAHPEIPVQPTQVIEGTVRDAATREPLAGVSIESWQFANTNFVSERHIRTSSGSDGRYRLVGMPKATTKTQMINGFPLPWGNRLVALPNDDQPYLMQEIDVPQAPGLETIKCDIELHRGIWIEGSVIDKQTGEPVQARLYYMPFFSNPYAQKLPEFPAKQPGAHGAQDRYTTREDGTFRIPGLPGRAIVGAYCFGKSFREGAGSESIEGLDKGGHFPVWGYPVGAGVKFPTTMMEINPPEGATSVTCDLEADTGASVHLKLIDREGKRVSGCLVRNAATRNAFPRDPLRIAELDVTELSPTEKRPIFIHHAERDIGQVVLVAGDGEHMLTVTLEPCATIKARLLDYQGEPLGGAMVRMDLNPSGDFVPSAANASTDEQGRLVIPNVLPGSDYSLMIDQSRIGMRGLKDKLSIKPGETIDLGDIRLKESE
jgi:protocatechuate 3,4-dioxygenase beta subunit